MSKSSICRLRSRFTRQPNVNNNSRHLNGRAKVKHMHYLETGWGWDLCPVSVRGTVCALAECILQCTSRQAHASAHRPMLTVCWYLTLLIQPGGNWPQEAVPAAECRDAPPSVSAPLLSQPGVVIRTVTPPTGSQAFPGFIYDLYVLFEQIISLSVLAGWFTLG